MGRRIGIFSLRMIAFLRGQFVEKSPSRVVIDVNGVGYEVQISLNTYSEINKSDSGLLHTYIHLFENGQVMYGFSGLAEKEMFLHLIGVSGVGPSTVRMMLSGLKPDEIAKAIVQGNAKQLESIKGIGKKTAERLIVELRDKLGKSPAMGLQGSTGGTVFRHNISSDATNALVALGIGKQMAEQSVGKVVAADPNIALEELIKQALKSI